MAHFAAVAEAARIPLMVQDAPLSGVQLPVAFLVRLAKSVPLVNSFKIEVPGAAAKLRALIAAGGDAIVGPFDGEESVTLMADLDAGALGTMPSALLPDLIKVVLAHYFAGRRERSGRGLRAHPAAHQLRESSVRLARVQDGDERRRRHQERRGQASARTAASGHAGRPARTCGERESAGASLGAVASRRDPVWSMVISSPRTSWWPPTGACGADGPDALLLADLRQVVDPFPVGRPEGAGLSLYP